MVEAPVRNSVALLILALVACKAGPQKAEIPQGSTSLASVDSCTKAPTGQIICGRSSEIPLIQKAYGDPAVDPAALTQALTVNSSLCRLKGAGAVAGAGLAGFTGAYVLGEGKLMGVLKTVAFSPGATRWTTIDGMLYDGSRLAPANILPRAFIGALAAIGVVFGAQQVLCQ